MTQQHPIPSSRPGQPGQMTAVMRAIPQASGPKVLRIGLVQGGKVIEERVIKQRTHVTIGPNEKSVFVIPSKSIPPSFRLFELSGGEYFLNFLDGMTGRIALKTGISELAALKSSAKRATSGTTPVYQLQLSEEARGKIVIGETTFLFQFVTPPPVQPKPQLPVSVKAGLATDIDWTTTIIAAFSFLFHFGAVGSIYSDWMDPIVDDEVDVAQLIESVKQLPPPPPVEQPKETVETPVATAATPTEAPKAGGGAGGKSGGGAGKGAGSVSDARAAAITNELAQLDMQMLGALNSSGNATSSVLSSGDVPLGLLENAAASGSGVGKGGVAGLNMGGAGGGTVRPGAAGGGGLASIGNTGSGGPATAGSAQKVKGPVGNAQVGGAAVSGGNVANASSVVAGMGAGFRRCYNKGLQEDPSMKGSVRITARIGPNGEVLSASPSGGAGLSGTVISCVAARVQSAQFAPPEGGGATVVIPVTFVSQ
jgi:hypothetical protein